MKVYVDLVFLLNYFFDLLLLLLVAYQLKRNVKKIRYFIGAFIGSLSIFFLFIPLNSFSLFILKILVSIVMIITTFQFKNIYYTLKNLFILYTTSMALGGILYFLNVQFSYKQQGLIFFYKGLSINVIFLIITSPLLLYMYAKQMKTLKDKYQHYYHVIISYQQKQYNVIGFVDTGNLLVDPYFKKPIILLNENIITGSNYLLVPIHTANSNSLLKCLKIDWVKVEGESKKKDVLVGITKINIDGVDCLLNTKMMGGTI